MQNLTDHLLTTATELDYEFRTAVDDAERVAGKPGCARWAPLDDYETLAFIRASYGFKKCPVPLLTPPLANAKLAKGVVPSYGLTLQHFRTVLEPKMGLTRSGLTQMRTKRLSINACPNAGHCTKVCVLDNGNGGFPAVQLARKWKTELLARHPEAFVRILAWELVRARDKHGRILFRPNVNSDVQWELILPSLVDGYVHSMVSYGYTKIPSVLESDGWLGTNYRVAYSWNETSDPDLVHGFLNRGGSVAVVTARKKGAPVLTNFPFGPWPALDADKTDEWMFADGIVGDLSAKGKARKLIGKSKFVHVMEEAS